MATLIKAKYTPKFQGRFRFNGDAKHSPHLLLPVTPPPHLSFFGNSCFHFPLQTQKKMLGTAAKQFQVRSKGQCSECDG